jgi:hypothetical protein
MSVGTRDGDLDWTIILQFARAARKLAFLGRGFKKLASALRKLPQEGYEIHYLFT